MKHCKRCKIDKSLDEFYNHKGKKDGKQNVCKICSKSWFKGYLTSPEKKARHAKIVKDNALFYAIGITEQQREVLFLSQHGKCRICGKTEIEQLQHTGVRLVVDHDHNTGDVRGLLCTLCNGGLGMFRDDIKVLHKAIEYLNNSLIK